MRRKVMAIAKAVFTLVATTAFAASRVGGSGCCPPCPFCHRTCGRRRMQKPLPPNSQTSRP